MTTNRASRRHKPTRAEKAQAIAVAAIHDELTTRLTVDELDAITGDDDSETVAYVRMSADKDLAGENVARDALRLARRALRNGDRLRPDPDTGLVIWVDNSLSASKYGKRKKLGGAPIRLAYARLLADVKDGNLRHLLIPIVDRLWRDPVELEEVIEICDYAEAKGYALNVEPLEAHPIDLNNPGSRLSARIHVAVAAHEADQTHKRVMVDFADTRDKGDFVGSIPPMGYRIDRTVKGRLAIVDELAELIRDAMLDIVKGSTFLEVAQRWEALGVERPRADEPWDATQVKQRLDRPALAGFITYQPLPDPDGVRAPRYIHSRGAWAPIVDGPLWDAFQGVLARNRSTYNARTSLRRRGPYTGLLLCGSCGSTLYRHPRKVGHRWACLKSKGGCGRNPVDGPTVEAEVARLAKAELEANGDSAEASAILDHVDFEELHAEVARLEGRAVQIRENNKSGRYDDEEYFDLRDDNARKLNAALLRLRTAQADKLGLDVDRHVNVDRLLDIDLASATDEEKRSMFAAVFPRGLIVNPNRELDVADRLTPAAQVEERSA